MEESTHAAPTIRGRKRLTEVERLAQDAEKGVGPPTAQCRQRESPDRYTGYMALMSKCVVTEPSSLEEGGFHFRRRSGCHCERSTHVCVNSLKDRRGATILLVKGGFHKLRKSTESVFYV